MEDKEEFVPSTLKDSLERIDEAAPKTDIEKKENMQEIKKKYEKKKEDKENEYTPKNLEDTFRTVFDKLSRAEYFIDIHPCYYDQVRNWWLWKHKESRWERVDETDILNAISVQATVNLVNGKEKNEMLEALRQVSRRNKPKALPPTFIQFKHDLIDIMTGERIRASPEWFATNPIPYELDESNFFETPIMDKIFAEWVGEENVKMLYEIIAYCCLPDYPLHRIFCFIGSGMNGKSKFLELLRRFVGQKNCCSTELDVLCNSKFEATRLHKKLVCMMGETNFNEMNKTSMLKKLSGGDLIGFEYKNKDLFEEMNYAKLLIATNSLPTTSDKTAGFYRRWMIIDFPNQFSEARDILSDIPQEEYNALATKCTLILKEVLTSRKFTNEGTIEERMKKYESKSNFLEEFIKEYTKESSGDYITLRDFYNKFSDWCKGNRHRVMFEKAVGKLLKEIGWEKIKRTMPFRTDSGKQVQAWCWESVKWNE